MPTKDDFRHNPDREHSTLFVIFEFGKFCSMNGLPPPTKNEYREVLTMEGFSEDEIEKAVKDIDAQEGEPMRKGNSLWNEAL